jgi:hypothetical protein
MSSSFRPWTSCKPEENIAHTQTISPCTYMCESSTAFSFSSLALFFIFEIFALAFWRAYTSIRHLLFLLTKLEYLSSTLLFSLLLNSSAAILYTRSISFKDTFHVSYNIYTF